MSFALPTLLISFSFPIRVMSSLPGNVRDPRVNGEFQSQRASNTGFDIFFYGNLTNIRIAGDLRRPRDWETVADLSFIGSFGHWCLNLSNVILTISGTMLSISRIFRGTWK